MHCDKITPTGFQPMLISATPIKMQFKLVFGDDQVEEVEGFVGPDGVVIPGFMRTADGKYIRTSTVNSDN